MSKSVKIDRFDIEVFANFSMSLYDDDGAKTGYQWNFDKPVDLEVGDAQQINGQTFHSVTFTEGGKSYTFNVTKSDLEEFEEVAREGRVSIPELTPEEPAAPQFEGFHTVEVESLGRSGFNVTIDGVATPVVAADFDTILENAGFLPSDISLMKDEALNGGTFTHHVAVGTIDPSELSLEPAAPQDDAPGLTLDDVNDFSPEPAVSAADIQTQTVSRSQVDVTIAGERMQVHPADLEQTLIDVGLSPEEADHITGETFRNDSFGGGAGQSAPAQEGASITIEQTSRSTYELRVGGQTFELGTFQLRGALIDAGFTREQIGDLTSVTKQGGPVTIDIDEGAIDISKLSPDPAAHASELSSAEVEADNVFMNFVNEGSGNFEITRDTSFMYSATDLESGETIEFSGVAQLRQKMELLGVEGDDFNKVRTMGVGETHVTAPQNDVPGLTLDDFDLGEPGDTRGFGHSAWDADPPIITLDDVDLANPESVISNGFNSAVSAEGAVRRDGSSPAVTQPTPETPSVDVQPVQIPLGQP